MKSHHVDYFWEDICEQQVRDVYDHYYEWYDSGKKLSNIYPIEQMDVMLNHVIDKCESLGKPITLDIINSIDNNPVFFDIASYAIFTIDRIGKYPYIDWHYISSILINKQKDYGTENITKFGLAGIIVRLSDKLARLNNLILKADGDIQNAISLNSVNGESIIDTLIDIIGYCTIALMVMDEDSTYKNKFLVPMKFGNVFVDGV